MRIQFVFVTPLNKGEFRWPHEDVVRAMKRSPEDWAIFDTGASIHVASCQWKHSWRCQTHEGTYLSIPRCIQYCKWIRTGEKSWALELEWYWKWNAIIVIVDDPSTKPCANLFSGPRAVRSVKDGHGFQVSMSTNSEEVISVSQSRFKLKLIKGLGSTEQNWVSYSAN